MRVQVGLLNGEALLETMLAHEDSWWQPELMSLCILTPRKVLLAE